MDVQHRRAAWARWLLDNEVRIKQLISERLGEGGRSRFDTSDGFASVLVRVDRLANHQDWRPRREDDVWPKLFEIVDDVGERHRLETLRTQQAERDPALARYLTDLLGRDGSVTDRFDEMIALISSSEDRDILRLRIRGASHLMIAQAMGIDEDSVSRRISRIYQRLRDQ